MNIILANNSKKKNADGSAPSKRKMTKKEAMWKIFEMSRFRNMEIGDYVAARLTSRDLWILARVVKDWNCPPSWNAMEYSSLSESKREALSAQHPVYVQDVEDKFGESVTQRAQPVPRHLILPLPRSYEEASEWCTRCRKGSRVYAMYPSTTSLYSATVIDSTTYCRNDDDIVVVEFDGDEDDFGHLPSRHIPARFVTLIPQEFPASAATTASSANKLSTSTAATASTTGQTKRRTSTSSTSKKGKSTSTPVDASLVAGGGKPKTKRRNSANTKPSETSIEENEAKQLLQQIESYKNSDFEKDLFDVFGNGANLDFS